MKVLYVSSTCSENKYYEYVEKHGLRVSQQAQKYNLLLAKGLAECGADVKIISSRPISPSTSKKKWFRGEREAVDGIEFNYVKFANFKLLRQLFVFFGTFFKLLFARGKRRDTVVMCDALNIMAAKAVRMASVFRGFKSIAIVTDVPCHRPHGKKPPMHERINLRIMKKFSAYLLLTEQMSEIVNPKGRPYVVLEGHSDSAMASVENRLEDKLEKKVCIYAGSLRKIYGIENLVRGFIAADIPDAELHVYGDGDFVKDLRVLCDKHPTVIYKGIAPNREVVEAELRATLLVNPRPTGEDYTKYSFPSKNMEYMASGTPVLTTKLPGMPAEYNDYVFLLEEENAEGIEAALKLIFSHTREELHNKGIKAKNFVMREKNNVVQASKVLDMIEKKVFKNGN